MIEEAEDLVNELETTEETTEASAQPSEDTTPTQEEYEQQEDEKLKWDTSKDKESDIIIEDEY